MPRARKKLPGSINPSAPASPGGALPAAPTGLPYGENKQLTNAQAAVPIGAQPMPAPAAPPSGAPAPAGPADMLAAAQNFQPPNIGLGNPTNRPDQHVMAGVNTPPSSALPFVPAQTLGGLLNNLAQTSPAVAQLAAYVASGKE